MMTIVLAGGMILAFLGFSFMQTETANEIKTIKLPPPTVKGKISLEEAIKKRRSERDFQDKALTLRQVSQILWAAQGITEERGFKRAAPSAGAFRDDEVSRLLSLPGNYKPLYVLPVGWVK